MMWQSSRWCLWLSVSLLTLVQNGTLSGVEEDFPFPADKGGKLVAETLQPKDPRADDKATGPRKLATPQWLENPSLPSAPYAGPPLRPPQPAAGRAVNPRHLPELVPLAGYHGHPVRPALPALPVAPLVRLNSADVSEVPPLPMLARPTFDRAPFTDPTIEASTAAALANSIPQRSGPAPFVRLNLPDPFEHHHAVRVRTSPSEDNVPVTPRR